MTTATVMTITDEQIAEIERDIASQAAVKPGQCEGGVTVRGEICLECGATHKDSCRRPLPKSYAVPSNITALISRLRAAEKDAERYRWLRDNCEDVADELGTAGQLYFGTYRAGRICEAIDAAMEQSR